MREPDDGPMVEFNPIPMPPFPPERLPPDADDEDTRPQWAKEHGWHPVG